MSEVVAVRRGRPPKYRPEYAELALHLCRLGGTNADLAKAFGVSTKAIDAWISKKPEFAELVREGRELADARVASALYQRAVGAVVPDTHIATHEGKTIITPLLKHYPPDTAACSLWLRNRQPDKWREKTSQAIEVTAAGDDALHQAAMRIMQADTDRLALVVEDEMAKIAAGAATVIPEDAPNRNESPLHEFLGLAAPRSEMGAREFAQMLYRADRELGPRGGAAIEAEIIPSGPALPPESLCEPVSPPEPVTEPAATPPPPQPAPTEREETGEDFRSLLGLPPRED